MKLWEISESTKIYKNPGKGDLGRKMAEKWKQRDIEFRERKRHEDIRDERDARRPDVENMDKTTSKCAT